MALPGTRRPTAVPLDATRTGWSSTSARGVVLLYGGAAAHQGALLNDMWQWDGSHWTQIRLAGPTPGHRYQPVMVYDRARTQTVLYGGIGDSGDTWEWDGHRWRQGASGGADRQRQVPENKRTRMVEAAGVGLF